MMLSENATSWILGSIWGILKFGWTEHCQGIEAVVLIYKYGVTSLCWNCDHKRGIILGSLEVLWQDNSNSWNSVFVFCERKSVKQFGSDSKMYILYLSPQSQCWCIYGVIIMIIFQRPWKFLFIDSLKNLKILEYMFLCNMSFLDICCSSGVLKTYWWLSLLNPATDKQNPILRWSQAYENRIGCFRKGKTITKLECGSLWAPLHRKNRMKKKMNLLGWHIHCSVFHSNILIWKYLAESNDGACHF